MLAAAMAIVQLLSPVLICSLRDLEERKGGKREVLTQKHINIQHKSTCLMLILQNVVRVEAALNGDLHCQFVPQQ